jgi:hypothetical protein
MNSFVKIAQNKFIQAEYNDRVRLNNSNDSFITNNTLSLGDSKTIIENNFNDKIKSLLVIPHIDSITLNVNDTIQLTAFLYRGTISGFNLTPDKFGQNVTSNTEWVKNPNVSNVVSISKGLIKAVQAGSVEVYAKVGDFKSSKITITVV